jgi:hypothetical protein
MRPDTATGGGYEVVAVIAQPLDQPPRAEERHAGSGHPRPGDDDRVEQVVAPVGAAAARRTAGGQLGEHAGLGHRVVRVQ